MRILLLSDIHGKISLLWKILKRENFDAIFIAGDFTYFEHLSCIKRIFKKMREITSSPIYFVPGNCDPPDLITFSDESQKIFNVHEKAIPFGDKVVVGFGGSNITPFSTLIEFPENVIKDKLTSILEKINPDKTLLLTHVPPYNTLDKIYSGEHVGSTGLREIIEKFNPLAVFCGHIHEEQGVTYIGRTIVIHPGPAMKGYYAIVEINKDKIAPILRKI